MCLTSGLQEKISLCLVSIDIFCLNTTFGYQLITV